VSPLSRRLTVECHAVVLITAPSPFIVTWDDVKGSDLLKIGHIGEGLRSLEDAISLAERAEHLYVLCWALYNVAIVYRMGGRFLASKLYIGRACTVAERQGNPMLIAVTIGGRGLISFFLGDWAGARADDERARASGQNVTLSEAPRVQALVAMREQRWDDAAGSIEEGLTLVRGMPFPYGEARLRHLSGALHAHQDPLDAVAREHLQAALAIFERLGARKAVERVRRDIAADHHDLYAASGTVSPA